MRGGGAESQAGSQEECEEADVWVAWRPRRAGEWRVCMLGGGWVRSHGWGCPSSPNVQTGADALFHQESRHLHLSVLTNKPTFNEPLKGLGCKSGAQTAFISD